MAVRPLIVSKITPRSLTAAARKLVPPKSTPMEYDGIATFLSYPKPYEDSRCGPGRFRNKASRGSGSYSRYRGGLLGRGQPGRNGRSREKIQDFPLDFGSR